MLRAFRARIGYYPMVFSDRGSALCARFERALAANQLLAFGFQTSAQLKQWHPTEHGHFALGTIWGAAWAAPETFRSSLVWRVPLAPLGPHWHPQGSAKGSPRDTRTSQRRPKPSKGHPTRGPPGSPEDSQDPPGTPKDTQGSPRDPQSSHKGPPKEFTKKN